VFFVARVALGIATNKRTRLVLLVPFLWFVSLGKQRNEHQKTKVLMFDFAFYTILSMGSLSLPKCQGKRKLVYWQCPMTLNVNYKEEKILRSVKNDLVFAIRDKGFYTIF
jgi:hypothetical protein